MKIYSISEADIKIENNLIEELVLEVLGGIQITRKQFTKIILVVKVKLCLWQKT